MKSFRIMMLVVAMALVGSTFTIEAKAKKRRSTTKKEKTMPKKKKNTKSERCMLDMVEYQHQTMMMQPVAEVRLERKNGNVVLATRGTNTNEKEFVLDDGEQLLKEALAIIEEEKMLDYRTSYELPPEMQPLDGYSWSFSARLADGRSISTNGYNAGPGGEGLGKMQKLLFKRASKLLGIEYF